AYQWPRLPKEYRHDPELTPVCGSAEQLKLLLEGWHRAHNEYTTRAMAQFGGRKSRTAALPMQSAQHITPGIIYLHRFGRPNPPKMWERDKQEQILAAAKAALGEEGTIARHDDALDLKWTSGSGAIYENRAVFDVADMDLLAARLILQVARTG